MNYQTFLLFGVIMLNLLVLFQVQRPPQDRSALSAACGECHVTD